MSDILIDKIRISGFRGLNNFEMAFNCTTVLTGMNNSGKTSVLKALQLAIGGKAFLEIDDLFTSKEVNAEKIIVDIRIVQMGDDGKCQESFDDEWETIFKADKIKVDGEFAYVPLRTIATYNNLLSKFDIEQQILNNWLPTEGMRWQDINGKKQSFSVEEMPFFYVDAQRDVVEDMKLKNSYLGKMLADVAKGYARHDIETLEKLIADLNAQAIEKSDILSIIVSALDGINSAMEQNGSNVELTPFAKKIRDLNRGVSIHYGDNSNSFTMDYHGMGTRSWSSLLTLKAFITHSCSLAKNDSKPFFPIIAIEEPESHLHPNAQKKLYKQMAEMPGQKIISTHSPYIAASAELSEVRGIYKNRENVTCGNIIVANLLNKDDKRKLQQKVINTRGELFFSKAIVLFEGETEEQALPILAEKYFKCAPSELGLDFVGVGGAGQYYPFLHFAETFGIPWYIFSDGEDAAVNSVESALKKIREKPVNIINEKTVFILGSKEDFERHILNQEFIPEIELSLTALNDDKYIENYILKNNKAPRGRRKTEKTCSACKQYVYEDYIRDYSDDQGYKTALYDMMVSQKTKFGLAIADSIVNSGKELPIMIKTLFDKIKTDLNHE